MTRALDFAGRRVALATMHGKERAIAPAFRDHLGAVVEAVAGIDTDQLGTFTGEVPRPSGIRETALRKARLGLTMTGADFVLASEGSFGPHPDVPFLAAGVELLMLVDRQGTPVLELSVLDPDPAFHHVSVPDMQALRAHLPTLNFPSHALIVRENIGSSSMMLIEKGLFDGDSVEAAVTKAARASADGLAHVENDMRADRNPTRMAAIARLASHFARRLAEPCPQCAAPGFGEDGVRRGLPCDLCGFPTEIPVAKVYRCLPCGHSEEREISGMVTTADPMHCRFCNP